jgi:cobalt/nickel transport protein
MSQLKKRVLIVLGLLLALVPLGLLTDAPAWGEWDLDYYKKVLGFIPKNLEKGPLFNSPLPDYSVEGLNPVVGYYISGVVGVLLLFGIYFLIFKLLKKRESGSKREEKN